MRSKIYIYIIFVLLIVANILHKLVYTRNMRIVVFTKNIQNCIVESVGWQLEIPHCKQYNYLEYIEVFSRQVGSSDRGFFQPKRLIAQQVVAKSVAWLSVKRWWQLVKAYIKNGKSFLLKYGLFYLSGDQAGLVAGMVFGGSHDLSPELKNALQVSGLTHVVSASGYNVSVVAGVVVWLAAAAPIALPRSYSGWLIILGVWSYALAAELVPPVVRAAIMISLNILSSRLVWRQQNTLFTWGITVAIMLACEPFYMTSLSFWLSAMATLGIIIFLPLLVSLEGLFYRLETGQVEDAVMKSTLSLADPHDQRYNQKKDKVVWLWFFLKESLAVTLSAQAFTTPLILLVFGRASYLSLVTNTLLLWLTPVITLAGLGLMLVGAILAGCSIQAGWLMIFLSQLVSWPVNLFINSVLWFGQFEWGVVRWQFSWWGVFLWWLVLFALIWRHHYSLHRKRTNIVKQELTFL